MSKKGQKTQTEQMSLSKQRKLERKQEIARRKKQTAINAIVWTCVGLLVIGLIVLAAVKSAQKKANTVETNTDYSAQLNANGMIKGVTASDYISIPDYSSIPVELSEVEYTDEEVQADIDGVLAQNRYVDADEERIAEAGDKVSIDYITTIDGVDVEDGEEEDYELELGSGDFYGDFEEQIAGHKAGDEFTVTVSYPEDYEDDADLAGCDVIYTVTLNGFYVTPEFTDEFVAENLAEYASTAEEYRQYLKDTNYKTNLSYYIQDYLIDNSSLKSVPVTYQKQLKGNYKAYEYSSCEYMNSIYSAYYGYEPYATFADYLSETYSMTEEEYDASLDEKIEENLKYALVCQAVAEAEGITASAEEARAHAIAEGQTEEDFDSSLENYGEGYIAQQLLFEKVIEELCSRADVK